MLPVRTAAIGEVLQRLSRRGQSAECGNNNNTQPAETQSKVQPMVRGKWVTAELTGKAWLLDVWEGHDHEGAHQRDSTSSDVEEIKPLDGLYMDKGETVNIWVKWCRCWIILFLHVTPDKRGSVDLGRQRVTLGCTYLTVLPHPFSSGSWPPGCRWWVCQRWGRNAERCKCHPASPAVGK